MTFFIDYKKLALLTGLLLTGLLIGYLIYALFFKAPAVPPAETTPPPVSGSGQLPAAGTGTGAGIIKDIGSGQLPGSETGSAAETAGGQAPAPSIDKTARGGVTETTRLNQAESFAPVLSGNGADLQYYNKNDGKFYRITSDGEISALSSKKFFNVQKVTWAGNKQKAILEYPDGANILYDFQNKKQITLPKHWENFDFSPQSDKIVAKSMGTTPENRWLMIANDDGSQARAIEPMGDNESSVYPAWSPNNLSIAIFTESAGFDRQKMYFIGQNNENFKSATIEGRGLDFKWTPSGDRLIYSVYSDGTNLNPALWIVNAKGEDIGSNRQRLNLETWANKCAAAGEETLYCAVPKSLPEGAGLFPQLAKDATDTIYQVNLKTGSKSLTAVPEGEYNVQNIIISEDERNLYFTDNATGNIHKIKLK
ncbi:hypothetical protein COT99_03935 [Candidatus Falkowbacteria bacterium CG10_big_fil_rev_8_21_14_0_10_43_10]|uniref:Dipeptidylpeptidase IV N-terminal domain-containing protein n=1 Tax=Candidatus Falkowbacteria bacterium CG10_big_fil_rev_8_21_14_0_10_43_10 TaxID=1974567 RepID=A0A2H0V1C4_9BACT|nr:MAG: hypothetical protein COT99_03935 [Candidatus Falkowbacteria bacterium CG10_big_fil_rev_8_21_14_0_10_43_10]